MLHRQLAGISYFHLLVRRKKRPLAPLVFSSSVLLRGDISYAHTPQAILLANSSPLPLAIVSPCQINQFEVQLISTHLSKEKINWTGSPDWTVALQRSTWPAAQVDHVHRHLTLEQEYWETSQGCSTRKEEKQEKQREKKKEQQK